MKIKYLIILVVFLSSLAVSSQDEISFEAKVSKEKLGINERLRVDFVMNRDGDNFVPPNFNGFQVNGPSQSISNSWVNGKKSYTKTYSYILRPLSRGIFTIKQASVEIEGKTYKTVPIRVQITAAVDNPNAPPSAQDVASENLHLVAEVSKTSPYLNEAVSVVYKLYVSPNINVRDFKPLDNPKYNNFWSQDIPVKDWKVQNGTYKGKSYRYVILKRVVLYAQKSGKLTLEPLSLDVTVDVPTNRRDFFGGRIYTQTHKTVAAGNRTINVKALPEKGKPESFTGAVGSFDFNVIPSKTDLKATESLQAKVEVTGKGNLKLFDLPKLKLPGALEVYDPEFEENVSTSMNGNKGKVSDNYTIVPQFRGKYPIPGINFSYFDPEKQTYKTLSSQEFSINVYEGPVNSGNKNSKVSSINSYKQPVVEVGNQFRFLKLKPNLHLMSEPQFFKSTLFYSLLLSPLLLIPLAISIGKKKKALDSDVKGNKIRKANKLARKYLSEAKKNLGAKEIFYESLERALHNYLKAKLHIETSEFSKDKIKELLISKRVNEDDVASFINLLKSCEFARYSPASEVTMQQDYERAVDVISQIDKQI
ncbi:BatD family protein [Ascidiimonas sp. W6]|uniref:BatD family protein n=1 Tax=Ascidiimonas meishanensis TaxID=3128903 RepID=UPI0030EC717D